MPSKYPTPVAILAFHGSSTPTAMTSELDLVSISEEGEVRSCSSIEVGSLKVVQENHTVHVPQCIGPLDGRNLLCDDLHESCRKAAA